VWALELAQYGITVNTIAPGPIAKDMFTHANPPDMPRTQEIIGTIPASRLGSPDDIDQAVAFFMDDRSSFINAQLLYVCDGTTLARGGG
jgi:NAD(P)-dependent dehydrogenase (short-subunit alcohol dehydrogenase family)